MQIYYDYVSGPVGDFLIAGTESELHFSSFPSGSRTILPAAEWQQDGAPLAYAARQFEAYFAGELVVFDMPLKLAGTDFQLAVWRLLMKVKFGETTSYGEIANALGKPGASRAVGAANGANHLPIVIPCHRVIGADGSLTGFGGGVAAKEALLKLEGIEVGSDQLSLF